MILLVIKDCFSKFMMFLVTKNSFGKLMVLLVIEVSRALENFFGR